MARKVEFETEAELVAAFHQWVDRRNAAARKHGHRRDGGEPSTWTIYHETGGYDLVLVEDQTGVQIAIEAKLALNLKVINQVLPDRYSLRGADYRAVLIPQGGFQRELGAICGQIGINVLTVYDMRGGNNWLDDRGRKHKPEWNVAEQLPDERSEYDFSTENWHPWLPIERIRLPEYVPDVSGGKASPVALTEWKIRAIKLLIVLDRRGHVTRADMKALNISPTRWTASSFAYLLPDKALGGYVACDNTPDLRRQHPVNYSQIEADADKWAKELGIDLTPNAG